MDYHTMKRKELQALCKKKNIPANLTNLEMANKLTSLIKGTGEPKAAGPSCLKNPIEAVVIEDSDVESKPSKKVKFTPQNELLQFTNSNPRETRRITRRHSMFVNNPVRATRTRAQILLDDGLVSSMNHPVEKEKSRKLKEVITKTDELKLKTRRLLRKREVMQNDAVSTRNHAEDEEKFECDDEIVNKVVRTTRSRAQGAANDGYVLIVSPPVEKKKGSKSRNAVAEIDEVILPTKRLLRNRKIDQNDADSIQDQVEYAKRFEPSEGIVNNPVRVTRSRSESSVDEGLASTMNPSVKMKSGRKSIVEITKTDEVKLPTTRLLRNRHVVQNDALATQNHAEDEERFECYEEIVKKVVRTTRSRAQGAANDDFVSIMNPPMEKKKGSKSRNAVAVVDEVILPTKRLLRNQKVDEHDADSIQDQVVDAGRFEPSEDIVKNPVRVTRSRIESSVDEGLASIMNPLVKTKSGRKSIVEIAKIDKVKLPTRRLLRNREVVQNYANTTQNHAEDEERFECDEEIVNQVVRTTRSRAQGAANDGFVSIMNPPVEKKKGSQSRNSVASIDDVILPTKRLLRNRKVDQNDAGLIQDHVEDAKRFEPNEEIVSNPVRFTRSRTDSSVDQGLASTMSPPVKMISGRKSIVEITKVDEAKLPTRRLSRNREVKESSTESIQSHIAKRGRKRTLDKLQEPQCVTVLSDNICDNKDKQLASVSELNGGKRQTPGRYNRRKTVVSQLADEEKVEIPKADVMDSSDVFTSSESPNLQIPDGAEEKLGISKRNGRKNQTSGRYNRRKAVVSQRADEEKVEYPKADVVDSSEVITSSKSPNLENPDGAEEKLDEILVQDYATKEVEDCSTVKAEGTETEKDETHDFVNMEEMLVDTDENEARVKVCSNINQASFTESMVAEDQEANNTAKYVEISPGQDACKTSSKACTEYIKELNEMTIRTDTGAFVSKNIESLKNDIEGSVDLVIEEGLNYKDYQETVDAKESQNEKDACIVTSAKNTMEETFIENGKVVRSNPCEEKESSSDEKLAEVATSLDKEYEGLKEIEQDISLHYTVKGVNDDDVEELVQGTLSCEATHVQDNVIQNFSNMDDSVDREKLDVVELATSDDSLKLMNHEHAIDSGIETSICDFTEGKLVKLQGENVDNRESTEDTAIEEHEEKLHSFMEESVSEAVSLHDKVVLEHPVSVSDDYGISSDLHSSLNAVSEEMTSKCENEQTTNVACEVTNEENSSEGCAELKQDEKLNSNNNALQRPTDKEDNGDGSNERWHEEELKILFATPLCENRTVRETGNISFGKFDKTREKNNGEAFSSRSNDGWHGTTEASQDEPTDSSLHLEQEMVNQDTEDSNAVQDNNIEQQISETMETSLKIVEKVEFIEENKKGVEDSTICYKGLDYVAGEDTLIVRTEANNELGSFEPDDNKDICELSVAESVYDSQSVGCCIHEQGEMMVEVVEGKLNEFQELVQNGGDFNAFTGSVIRKFVEQVEVVEVVEVDESNARQSETENVDENQSSVIKANDTKSIADFCFDEEELNNMFATSMVNQEIKTYNVVKSNNIEVRISEEIMESAFRSVERVEVIDGNKKKTIVEESTTSEVDLDMVIENVSMEANIEVEISKEPNLEDSLSIDKCSDVQERVYECKTDDLCFAGHVEEEVRNDVLEDKKGIGECGDFHICENQISVITLDTAEAAEVTTENPKTEIESEIEKTVTYTEGAESSVAIADESNAFIHVAVQDEQVTLVDSSFFHDQETVNQDTNEILQNCGEFDAYTDWAATTFAEHIQVEEFEESNARESEIDCEIEQPPSVTKVAFNSEAIANVSDGFFDLADEDEQLLPLDSSFFHDQETVNQEINNKMIKFNAFTGSASKLCAGHFHVDEFDKSNAQETEIESGHRSAPGVAEGAENSVAISDESNEFFHLVVEDNSPSLHDKEMVNQEIDDKMSEDLTNLAPKSVQEVQDHQENKKCIVGESIFENKVGDIISEVLEDKVYNIVEEDQQMWEEKYWNEANNVEEDQHTWAEKWSEVNMFDDIQGDFDGIANVAQDTCKSSSDASDDLTEDGEVDKFDEVNQCTETALSVANGEGEVQKESNYESVCIQNQTAMRPNDKKCYSTTMKVKIKNTLMNGTPNRLMKENDRSVKKEPRTENITEAKCLTKRRALGWI